MPRKATDTTEKAVRTKREVKPKQVQSKVVKAPVKAATVKKTDETTREIRRQVKSLQSTMKSNKFTDEWEEVGDSLWFKFKGDKSEKHFVIQAIPNGRKYEYRLFGLSPVCEYNTQIDEISIGAESDKSVVLRFTNKLGEYTHKLVV